MEYATRTGKSAVGDPLKRRRIGLATLALVAAAAVAAMGAAAVLPHPTAPRSGAAVPIVGAVTVGTAAEPAAIRWRLDGPRYRSRDDLAAAADRVVVARVVDLLAAGPESAVLGGGSPLPVQIWRAAARRAAPVVSGGWAAAVVVPDPESVWGMPHLAAGDRIWLALRCSGVRFDGLPVCSPVGTADGVRLLTSRRRR